MSAEQKLEARTENRKPPHSAVGQDKRQTAGAPGIDDRHCGEGNRKNGQGALRAVENNSQGADPCRNHGAEKGRPRARDPHKKRRKHGAAQLRLNRT